MSRLRVLTFFCLLVFAAGLAAAGVVIEFETTTPGETKKMTGSLYLEKDRMRSDVSEVGMIYRADKELVWLLQPRDKAYLEMTREGMEELAAKMAEAREQLKNMPPGLREKMEKMMGGGGGADAAPPRTYKKTGKSGEINGYPCDEYEAWRGDKVEQTLWVAPFDRFELSASDFTAMTGLVDFMKSAMGPLAKEAERGFYMRFSEQDSPDALPGVPVRVVTPTGKGDTIYDLKKLGRQDIAPQEFEVPAGYKKREMGPNKG